MRTVQCAHKKCLFFLNSIKNLIENLNTNRLSIILFTIDSKKFGKYCKTLYSVDFLCVE